MRMKLKTIQLFWLLQIAGAIILLCNLAWSYLTKQHSQLQRVINATVLITAYGISWIRSYGSKCEMCGDYPNIIQTLKMKTYECPYCGNRKMW